ncbi:hypothetical protein L2E82_09215 [Cichorium intybus]|uniref:Uncharacterized protein n=1 Tax=Cichorium intybus TaxID=13427 RepID=A0ACB9G7U3_CICIN|nr:hypothetical protein L2E82_09215 [Cichorium intybus]
MATIHTIRPPTQQSTENALQYPPFSFCFHQASRSPPTDHHQISISLCNLSLSLIGIIQTHTDIDTQRSTGTGQNIKGPRMYWTTCTAATLSVDAQGSNLKLQKLGTEVSHG